MKKMILLVLLLAIAGITAAQTKWKTVTLPFATQTDVNALLAYSDHYIAFGNVGEALRAYYDSTTTAPVNYTDGMPDPWKKYPVRNACKTSNNLSIVVGDESLIATSTDSGLTWHDWYFGTANNSLIIEDSIAVYILGDGGLANGGGAKFYDFAALKTNVGFHNYIYRQEQQLNTTPITGFNGKNGVGVVMPKTTGSSCFSYTYYSMDPDFLRPKEKFSTDDSIVSAISDSIVSILAVSKDGSYSLYKSDGKELLGKVAIDNIVAGDHGFIPYGCLSLNGTGYFIGLDKDEQAIKIGLDNSREIIDVEIIPTCLATVGDTLLIGGKNGKIAMLDKLTTSLKPATRQKFNILVRKGNTTFITGEGRNISWTVISMLGKVVGSGNGQEINLTVSPGMYIVRMKIDKETIVQKTIF